MVSLSCFLFSSWLYCNLAPCLSKSHLSHCLSSQPLLFCSFLGGALLFTFCHEWWKKGGERQMSTCQFHSVTWIRFRVGGGAAPALRSGSGNSSFKPSAIGTTASSQKKSGNTATLTLRRRFSISSRPLLWCESQDHIPGTHLEPNFKLTQVSKGILQETQILSNARARLDTQSKFLARNLQLFQALSQKQRAHEQCVTAATITDPTSHP